MVVCFYRKTFCARPAHWSKYFWGLQWKQQPEDNRGTDCLPDKETSLSFIMERNVLVYIIRKNISRLFVFIPADTTIDNISEDYRTIIWETETWIETNSTTFYPSNYLHVFTLVQRQFIFTSLRHPECCWTRFGLRAKPLSTGFCRLCHSMRQEFVLHLSGLFLKADRAFKKKKKKNHSKAFPTYRVRSPLHQITLPSPSPSQS